MRFFEKLSSKFATPLSLLHTSTNTPNTLLKKVSDKFATPLSLLHTSTNTPNTLLKKLN